MPFKLICAYGSEQCMVFESLIPDFTSNFQVLLRANPKSLYSNKSNQKSEADDELKNKVLIPIIDEDRVKYKTSNSAEIINKKITKKQDIPIECRIDNLEANPSSNQADKENFAFSSESRVQLLIQALHSKDKE